MILIDVFMKFIVHSVSVEQSKLPGGNRRCASKELENWTCKGENDSHFSLSFQQTFIR